MKKKIIFPIVMLLLLIVITVRVTFAAFTFTQQGQVENTLETSTVVLTYTEGKTGITLNEAYPMSDEKGKVLVGENNVFDFTVQATLGKSNVISYEVAAVKIPITDMPPLEDNEVKLYLERAADPEVVYHQVLSPSNFIPIENQTEVGSPIGSMVLESGIFMEEGTTIHHYRLRMWVDEKAEIPNGESRKYGVKVNVYAKQLLSDSFTDEACFTFDSSTGTITRYSNDCPKDVVIPYTIDGVRVNIIGDRAFAVKQLTSITIPNSVTSIGEEAFLDNQLTNIIIPSTVTTIGSSAFNKNQVPDETAFIYNRNEDGSIDNSILVSYAGAKKNDVIIPQNVKVINPHAFSNIGLISITIPNSVTTIGRFAFYRNNLSEIVIPDSVEAINSSAFAENKIISLVLSNKLKKIESGIFYQNQIQSITIPAGVTIIEASAFSSNQLQSITIPDSVTIIEAAAFSNNQLTTITLSNNISRIGSYAFENNLLTSVVLPNRLTQIEYCSFRNNQLKKVTLPTSLQKIEYEAFKNNQLTSIIIPSKVTIMERDIFTNNPNLTKVVNQTGKSFNWDRIISGNSGQSFVTGTTSNGVIVTNS